MGVCVICLPTLRVGICWFKKKKNIYIYISLSTVVLNSRDTQKCVGVCFIKTTLKCFSAKTVPSMDWYSYFTDDSPIKTV